MASPIRRELPSLPARPSRITFDNFEVDVRSGEVRKHGSRIKLQAQPFQLLVLLLRDAGEVISRDEICRQLWPADTFVDFEHSLPAAVNKIREALGDSADDPKFIETLPKRGYRFIGKIKPEAPVVMPAPEANEPAALAPVPVAAAKPHSTVRLAVAAVSVAVIVMAAFFILRSPRVSNNEAPLVAVPFTSYPGLETAPSVSPDGSRIAFAWDHGTTSSSGAPAYDLYVKSIGSETLLRLTNHPSEWISSAWSPDGTQIAFHRIAGADTGIYLVPALGGPERKLHSTHAPYDVAAPLSWSPDGKWLAFSDAEVGAPGDRAFLLNTETLEAHQFPHDPSCVHEGMLHFSHSGQQLASLCVHSTASFEYFISDIDGKSRRSLATVHNFPSNTVWSAADKSLIIAQYHADGPQWSEIRVNDGSVRKVPLSPGGEWPDISPDGRKLAFALQTSHINAWRRDLSHPEAASLQMYTSTLQDNAAQYSPDGRHVAFDSTRSGTWSVWMADPDGGNLVQISHGKAAGFPRWSPDSQKITFQMEEEDGTVSVYIADISDRKPRKLSTGFHRATTPSWSHDGEWIYFRTYEGIGQQIYRCPAAGGNATLIVASKTLDEPIESADGKTLYYIPSSGDDRLMMLPLDRPGATPQPVPNMPKFFSHHQWAIFRNGIYFTPQSAPRVVSFYDSATQKTREIFRADRDLNDGMSVSPDGRYILYSQLDENNSNIMLVSNFHSP